MSIALDSGNYMIKRSRRFIHGISSLYTKGFDQDHRLELEEDSSSSSSSSVGNDSDDEPNGSSEGEEAEVQSSFKAPLDTMDQLEEVFPVKRGLSEFYDGRSKTFTNLADASSLSTVKELAKPDNPYNKKRKNLLTDGYYFRDLKINGGGIRRSASFGRPPLHPYRRREPGNGSSDLQGEVASMPN
ncbi:protein OXIDATIVE STRESS 3 LIKE 1-like [Argentina anserina]|uniref:protein OXIDATIVE STRESS 3 LIKE 1-like n=1 Tax=Argentina anserina TaxID=57926 RepID=UPI00217648DB|nr:protein OXIDATIVE STRESS 3 LIKE 1-like [Potentilla anserina]